MIDLVYLGYTWDEGSKKTEDEFIKEVETRFPEAKVTDAFDDIKGYRRNIEIDDSMKDEYLAWIVAEGWHGCSITTSLMFMDESQEEDLDRIIDLAKKTYPENFKQDEKK